LKENFRGIKTKIFDIFIGIKNIFNSFRDVSLSSVVGVALM